MHRMLHRDLCITGSLDLDEEQAEPLLPEGSPENYREVSAPLPQPPSSRDATMATLPLHMPPPAGEQGEQSADTPTPSAPPLPGSAPPLQGSAPPRRFFGARPNPLTPHRAAAVHCWGAGEWFPDRLA